MRLRSLVLALALASGVASAATKHPKPVKVARHVKGPKASKHSRIASNATARKGRKVAKRNTKARKYKAPKTHKA